MLYGTFLFFAEIGHYDHTDTPCDYSLVFFYTKNEHHKDAIYATLRFLLNLETMRTQFSIVASAWCQHFV